MSESDARDFVFPLQCAPSGGVVRVIRGWKCGDRASLHNEIGAALQFPEYYGENWNAMDECIRDLIWLPGDWYLLHVCAVESLLAEDLDQFRIFLDVLVSAQDGWERPRRLLAQSVSAVPFHTIISGSESGLARVKIAATAGTWA